MALFLSPYVGTGTKDDPFRPRGLYEPGVSAIDLRLDPTKADGDGIRWAVLWSPSGIPDPTGAIKLADDYGDLLTTQQRNALNTRLELDFGRDATIQDAIETIMLRPDSGRWKQLRPSRGRVELWLGSGSGKRRWIDAPVLAGGSITDDFTRANEAVLKYPWVRQGGGISTAALSSNAITGNTGNSGSSPGRYYYDRSRNGWHADHSSSLRYVSAITNSDWAVSVRNGSVGLSAYRFEQFSSGRKIAKTVSGTNSDVELVSGSASTGVTYKLDVSGSTIRYYEDGVEHASSPASDTSLASAGYGPGFILYIAGGSLDEFVATGEQTPSSGIIYLGTSSAEAPDGADVTIDLSPFTLQQNDLVVLSGAIGDNDDVDFTMGLVGASGWTKEADLFSNDTQDVNLGVWTKVMGSTPDTSVVVDGQGGTDAATVGIAQAFRHVDPTTPLDVAATTATGTNTAHADPPSINHNNPSGVATVVVVASGNTNGDATTYAPPTGYEVAWDSVAENDTSDVTLGMGANFTPSDPEDPGTSTYSSGDSTNFAWAAVTLALRPAPTSLSATISQATETNLAQPIMKLKQTDVAQASETDQAQPMTAAKLRTLGMSTESDLAQPMTVINSKVATVTQVEETDLAQPITPRKLTAFNQASETDQAQPMTAAKLRTLGMSTESDLAQPMTVINSKVATVTQVEETDLAQPITINPQRRLVAQVIETDLAQPMTKLKQNGVAQASETDQAQPMTAAKLRTLGIPIETDLAQVIARQKLHNLSHAIEFDLAQPIMKLKQTDVAQASETDQAQPMTAAKLRTLGIPIETDLAQLLTRVTSRTLGQALEIDAALAITQASTVRDLVLLRAVSGSMATASVVHGQMPTMRRWS